MHTNHKRNPSLILPSGGGGVLPSDGLLGCAAVWGRISTTRLNITGLSFQAFSIELLQWGLTFSGLEIKKNICLKVTKMGSIIGNKTDQKLTIMG